MKRLSSFAFVFAIGLASACSDDPETMQPDASVASDAGIDADAGADDAGIRAKCVIWDNPACTTNDDCGNDNEVSNCPGCLPYNQSMCGLGTCETPQRYGGGDVHTVIVGVLPTITARSFAGHILASTTTGGNTLTCAEVYASGFSLDDPCYNIIDTRRYGENAQVGDVYRLPFTQFPVVEKILFVVHAFDEEGTMGTRTGISCTEYDTLAPGSGPQDVPGDIMRRL